MSKSKIHSFSTISIIFLLAVLAIVITFLTAHVYFGAQFNDDKDIFNWVGLVVEIGVAAGITGAVLYYTKSEQTKTNNLISDIHKITEKLDTVINEQNKLQRSRKQFLHESMFGNLISILNSAFNISQDKPIRTLTWPNGKKMIELNEFHSLNQMVDILNERISQFGELMEPELYASVSTVCNLLKGEIGKEQMDGIIQQSKRGINAIDTSLFSKNNIKGIEILEKI